MRLFLALLMAIGVFAGAMGRAASHAFPHHHLSCGTAGCESVDAGCCGKPAEEPACCSADHHHAGAGEDEQEPKTPDHHHHHICCVMSPLATGDETRIVFLGVDGVWAPLSVEHQAVPEGPVFELDMPPLI